MIAPVTFVIADIAANLLSKKRWKGTRRFNFRQSTQPKRRHNLFSKQRHATFQQRNQCQRTLKITN